MSNSPPPPAQDGERERLIADMTTLIPVGGRSVATRIAKIIRTQSAELAALRAQVAERMLELEAWRHEWNVAFSHASKNKNRRWVLRCLKDAVDASLDAALAPPQPVAKETKP